jgi:hypothetical protein
MLRSPGSSDLDCPVADAGHDVDCPADDEHYGRPFRSTTKSSRTSAVPGRRGRSSLRLWILLFHHIEHAAGRRSTRPIVDNVGDLARINFLWSVAWLRTIAVRRS